MTQVHLDPKKRHDIKLLVEYNSSNPNGNIDDGNRPRLLPNGYGFISAESTKRKARDFVLQQHQELGILVRRGVDYNLTQEVRKLEATGDKLRELAQSKFFDVRLFGAVLTLGKGEDPTQVRGPFQMEPGYSLHPIEGSILQYTLTGPRRGEEEKKRGKKGEDEENESDEIEYKVGGTIAPGGRSIVKYALYEQRGYYNPTSASDHVTSKDLEVLWESLLQGFMASNSSGRHAEARGLYIFTHDSPLGNANASDLLDSVNVNLNDGVTQPQRFGDFTVVVPKALKGVTLTQIPAYA